MTDETRGEEEWARRIVASVGRPTPQEEDAAARDYAETALSEAHAVLQRIALGAESPARLAAALLEGHGFERATVDPVGFAADVYDVPRELVEGARDHLAIEEIPTWTDGWTAGYAAGIKRALADCPTHGVCPNCREGWGHYTYEHGYLPTVQSEGGDL